MNMMTEQEIHNLIMSLKRQHNVMRQALIESEAWLNTVRKNGYPVEDTIKIVREALEEGWK